MKRITLALALSLMPMLGFAQAKTPPKMVTSIVMEVTVNPGTRSEMGWTSMNGIPAQGFVPTASGISCGLSKPFSIIFGRDRTTGFVSAHDYTINDRIGNLINKVTIHFPQTSNAHVQYPIGLYVTIEENHPTYDREVSTLDGKVVASIKGEALNDRWIPETVFFGITRNGGVLLLNFEPLGGLGELNYEFHFNEKKTAEFTLPTNN